jgi:hypothetical protein
MNLPEPPPVIPGGIRPLLERLGDPDAAVREAALREAEGLPPEDLAEELRDFAALTSATTGRWIGVGCTSILGLPAAMVALWSLLEIVRGGDSNTATGVAVLLLLAATPIALGWNHHQKQKQLHRLTETLTRCTNRGATGALLVASESSPSKSRLPILEALERLLSQFQIGDHPLLTDRERERLHYLLNGWSGMRTDGQIAVLHALSTQASTKALELVRYKHQYVRRLSDSHLHRARLLDAVVAAEAAIEANLAAQRSAKVLLRPAAAGAADATLLRPAGAGQDPHEALLRPSVSEPPPTVEQEQKL